MNAVKIIYQSGIVADVNRKMTLQEMQKIVGGAIELVPSNIPHRSLVVNEEGLFVAGLEPNRPATKLVARGVMMSGPILGNAILIKS